MKIQILFAAFVVSNLFATIALHADECWTVSNIRGFSAYSDQNYEFTKDGISNVTIICLSEKGGTVTGTDTKFVKFGKSTLAGYGGNFKGNELFEVYQIDREKKKLLYTKTRIGTKSVMPIFSDVISSFVGDAKRINK